jgi:hypothetical protein
MGPHWHPVDGHVVRQLMPYRIFVTEAVLFGGYPSVGAVTVAVTVTDDPVNVGHWLLGPPTI